VKLLEIIYDEPTERLSLVFELLENNAYELIKNRKKSLEPIYVKRIIYSILKALSHIHRLGVFHRDVKPENIMLDNQQIKLVDFGSCRGIHSIPPLTEYISTRWYRAPECLMTEGYYTEKMDNWSVGCVLFELLTFFPLFPGDNEIGQIN